MSSIMTPNAPSMRRSIHEMGHGFMLSKIRKSMNASVTDSAFGSANISVRRMPAVSSMTIILESWVLDCISNFFAAHSPIKKIINVAIGSAMKGDVTSRATPNGIEPNVPQKPGAGKIYPQPNHVDNMIAGSFFLIFFSVSARSAALRVSVFFIFCMVLSAC